MKEPIQDTGEERQETTTYNKNGLFSEENMKGGCSVGVAVRVRPLLGKEMAVGDQECVKTDSVGNTLLVGHEKQFSFDRVFGTDVKQEDVFEVCVKNLVLGCFSGYNATVLAYGQTGSGKTFTMGTDATLAISDARQGILPRVIQLMFEEVEKRKSRKEFLIKASFIEIYNEEIRDLLDVQGQSKIIVRELTRGFPTLCGQKEESVSCYGELIKLLEKGALHRRTRSTMMNESSSRSHAIFTINIEQHLIEDLCGKDPHAGAPEEGQEFTTAKFHFVDLAGSERIKKTGAEGETLHEGISINKALFVLGKVINALTDESGRSLYRPYRESNLTRILQDSLGGNARTTMIACVSPAESSIEETLSTLLYACKARSIKNKPVVNRDPNSTLIHQLQQQVSDLQRELARYKKSGTVPAQSLAPDLVHDCAAEKELRSDLAQVKRQLEAVKGEHAELSTASRAKEIELLGTIKERDTLLLENAKMKELLRKHSLEAELELVLEEIAAEGSLVEKYRERISKLEQETSTKRQELKELAGKYEEECRNGNMQGDQLIKLSQELQELKRTMVRQRRQEVQHHKFHKKLNIGNQKENHSVHNAVEESIACAAANGPWVPMELDEQMKEINELFLCEITNSLGTLIVEPAKSAAGEAATEINETETETEIETETAAAPEPDSAPQDEAEVGSAMKETLNKVEGDIHEREKMLEQIKEKHKEMQNNLIEIMKQQYHKKVEELEVALDKLKADQARAMQHASQESKGTIELQYRKKISEYEGKIKDCKRNDSQQAKLHKQTCEQEWRIHQLTDEIGKMKQQKVELTRQIKRDRENYEKVKREGARECSRMKQENMKQKLTIARLTKEKEREKSKLREMERKDAGRLPKLSSSSSCRQYIEALAQHLASLKQESAQLLREESAQLSLESRIADKYKELSQAKLKNERLLMQLKELNPDTDFDGIARIEEELVRYSKIAQGLQGEVDNMETTLQYHEDKSVRIEHNRNLIKTQLGSIFGKGKLKSAREMNEFIGVLFDVLAEAKLQVQQHETKCQADLSGFLALQEELERMTKDNVVAQQEYRDELLRLSQEYYEKEQALKTDIERLRNSELEARKLKVESSSKAEERGTANLKKELEEHKKKLTEVMKENSNLRNQIIALTGQNDKLSKNTVQLARKVDDLSTKLKKSGDPIKVAREPAVPKLVSLKEQRISRKLRERERKEDCGVAVHNSSMVIPQSREEKLQTEPIVTPACLIQSTAKLVVCKPSAAKSSILPIPSDKKNRRSVTSIGYVNEKRDKSPMEVSKELDEIMFETITPGRGACNRKSVSRRPVNVPVFPVSMSIPVSLPMQDPFNKWKCIETDEYHSAGISSLASFEHLLASSSNSLKLWDINKKSVVAELPNTTSKCLYVDSSRKLLIGSTEVPGAVHIWSLPSLELVTSLETGLDYVRTLFLHNSTLFVGGAGSIGALQLWDLNSLSRVCEKEKSSDKDVFSIFAKDSVVYYGGRNRCISRMRLNTLESLPPLSPTHYGAVNVLRHLGNCMISGCREYLLRTWDYESGKQKYSEVKRATTINASETDREEEHLYVAGKDGHVKVWSIREEKLQDVADLISHTRSVNGIARVDAGPAKQFASASDDRTVKLWKLIES